MTDWTNPDEREAAIAAKWGEAEARCKELQAEIDRLRDWIQEHGEQTDVCTRNVLGTICVGCRCGAPFKD